MGEESLFRIEPSHTLDGPITIYLLAVNYQEAVEKATMWLNEKGLSRVKILSVSLVREFIG